MKQKTSILKTLEEVAVIVFVLPLILLSFVSTFLIAEHGPEIEKDIWSEV